ncbi:DUF3857 domain-containing protein [Carboxylicivirga marina]|uniref:DUF3857 domain-containing protein n=1 Tax=Carboxylicivirga marina TaxID=2800988 RepID=UPI002598E586|nr:DUF3857 domain-containing protein [uncultured Carboxylicivirga sp.]
MKHHCNLLVFALLFLSNSIWAKDKLKYPVDEIPKALLSNAHAVVRYQSSTTEYVSASRMASKQTIAITILKESALELSYFTEGYTKLYKIEDIEGAVYDRAGKRIKRFKQDDIIDRSAISEASLYDDTRVKLIDPQCTDYPFTVEYSYSMKMNNSYIWPSWSLYKGMNVSVQESVVSYKVPQDYNFRYKVSNFDQEVQISEEDDCKTYTWKAQNYAAPTFEPLSPPVSIWAPNIDVAPSYFELKGYNGNLESWKGFGDFCYSLIEGRDNIPEETINEIGQSLTDEMTDYEKISKIYEFSQKKNRYISIQEGIGGQQPFDAETVDRLSYGDCKALTNYIMSILNHFGYKSHYTIVSAGEDNTKIDPEFVADNFNHVFLNVELPKDTLWIECTNSHSPCGYISDFTDDRNVLVVKNGNSELIKTPSYSAEENRQAINAIVNLNSDGYAEANVRASYKGALYGNEFWLTTLDEQDRKKHITNSIDIPTFKIDKYDIDVIKKRSPELHKTIDLILPDFATKMGTRLLLKTNKVNDFSTIPAYARNRKNPVYIRHNYSECDTLTYNIPENMQIESIPKDVNVDTPYGRYCCSIKNMNNQLIVYRYLEINKGMYPKEEYNIFREFLEKIATADKATTILIPKT